jgi:L-seryl-tRNA(Ser) seleniumtransferase
LPDGISLDEPVVRDVVSDGADIVTFSADKLLGASQAGVIVGRAELVQRIAKNPLSRAIRIDKLSLAALDATLRLYLKWPSRFHECIPTLSMLTTPLSALKRRAERIRRRIRSVLGARFRVELEPGASKAGGGSLPLLELPTMLVAVSSAGVSAEAIERALRAAPVPVIARIAENKVLLDPRTVLEADVEALVDAFRSVGQENGNHE